MFAKIFINESKISSIGANDGEYDDRSIKLIFIILSWNNLSVTFMIGDIIKKNFFKVISKHAIIINPIVHFY